MVVFGYKDDHILGLTKYPIECKSVGSMELESTRELSDSNNYGNRMFELTFSYIPFENLFESIINDMKF